MAYGTRRTNTAAEALQEMLQQVAYIQSLPDADLDFLTTLQVMLLAKLREPMQQYLQMVQGQLNPAQQQVPMAPSGTGPIGAVPSPVPGPPPGLRSGGQLPSVDELRRLVGQSYG
jgi:hypothetical protein